MNTIQEQWEAFSKLTLPANASPIQRQEVRRAFYGGVEGMVRILDAVAASNVSEEAGMQILNGCQDELRRFATAIARGQA